MSLEFRPPREDSELRAVLARASAAGVRRTLSAPAAERVVAPEVVRLAIVAAALILLFLLPVFAPASVSSASSVLDAGRHVRSESGASSGAVLFPVVTGTAAGGRDGGRRMAEARRRALSAAVACAGVGPVGGKAIDILSNGVSGPSAGLAFALRVVDVLLGEDLIAGRRVVATGTISPEGRVGEVGRIALKAQAAERAGADVFFVPATQVDTATAATTALRVVGVRDLDSALRRLGHRGCRR